MAAIAMRLRAELRSRGRTWLGLAAVIGASAGLALALGAGARRADSAIDRWRDATQVMDVWVGRGDIWQLRIDLDRVERLPQVQHSVRSLDMLFWARTDRGRPLTVNDTELNVAINGRDGAASRPKFVDGRAPHPGRADEIYVGSNIARQFGLRVGSTLLVRFATRAEAARIAATGEHDPRAHPRTAGAGPLRTLRVVGVDAEVQSEDATGFISISPAFAAEARRLGVWIELTGVRLRHGRADLDAFRAGVERVAAGRPIGFYAKEALVAKLRSSIHLQAQALWVLAALTGFAALLGAGQALARQTALESGDHPLLRSLGMTNGQLFGLAVARIVPVAVGAGVIAVAVAVALSPVAPIGVARLAEPDPGVSVDALMIAAGAPAIVALVLVAALGPAWRASRPAPATAPRSSRTALALARLGARPSTVAGVRMALEGGGGRTAPPARPALLGAVVAVAAVSAALTIAASADRLLSTPRLYGQNWDLVVGNGTHATYPQRLIDRVRADPAVRGLSVGAVQQARLDGRPTDMLAVDRLRGAIAPTVTGGRAPARANELLLGASTADALGRTIGEEIDARIGRRSWRFRVVGVGVLPDFGASAGNGTMSLGHGAATTHAALRRLDPQALRNIALVDLSTGVDPDAALARLQRAVPAAPPQAPADVGNWGQIEGFPYLIASLLAAVAAGALAHTLVTTIRRRRRDLAILTTLGFERREIRAVVAWHATTVAVIGLVGGLPLGAAVGRLAWNLFAQELGVVPEPVIPLTLLAVVAVGMVAVANLVALAPAHMAAATRPAAILRAE
jgi:FtsX-like permease family